MAPIVIRINIYKIKKFFRQNFGAPFIIGFQMLLIVCAGLLVSGGSFLANRVANVAYFLLFIGIFLQLVSYVLENKEN